MQDTALKNSCYCQGLITNIKLEKYNVIIQINNNLSLIVYSNVHKIKEGDNVKIIDNKLFYTLESKNYNINSCDVLFTN